MTFHTYFFFTATEKKKSKTPTPPSLPTLLYNNTKIE